MGERQSHFHTLLFVIGGSIILAITLFLTGCGQAAAPEPTAVPATETAEPTLTPAPTNTATAVPPTETATAVPTATPLPTDAPIFAIPEGISNLYIEYIIDASGSMLETLDDGVLKKDAAREFLIESMLAYNAETQLGLRSYGHRVNWQEDEEASCEDIELIAPVELGQMNVMAEFLQEFDTLGMTPLHASVEQALEDFDTSDPERINNLVLISDGIETCAGDPCKLVELAQKEGVNFTLHVVGVAVDLATKEQLECMATEGGGVYYDVHSSADFQQALADIQQEIVVEEKILSFADATATAQPTATRTPRPSSTPRPTNTPVPPTWTPAPPTWTPAPPTIAPTPTLPPQPTNTLVPSPVSTEPAPTNTPLPQSGCGSPTLLSPEDGKVFQGNDVPRLSWAYDCELAQNQFFDVRLWRDGDPHYGVTWTKENSYPLDYERFGPGFHNWSVAVVSGQDGVVDSVVADEGPSRRFEWRELEEINPTPTDEVPLGTGDVQITLRWGDKADLDLHVIDPNGEEISYSNPSSTSGGRLDRDANVDCSEATNSPVENIFWPSGEAPNGSYVVKVVYFNPCGDSDVSDFTVNVLVDGQSSTYSGKLSRGESTQVTTFSR
jgi:hypothetical protein